MACLDQYRGTGRTTQMLKTAVNSARKGGMVVVIGLHGSHVKHLAKEAHHLADGMGAGWVLGHNLRILASEADVVKEMEPGRYMVLGHQPDLTLVDHHVLEAKYFHVLENWLRGQP